MKQVYLQQSISPTLQHIKQVFDALLALSIMPQLTLARIVTWSYPAQPFPGGVEFSAFTRTTQGTVTIKAR